MQRPSSVSHTAWHPRSTMVRGRSSAQSCRRCRKSMFCVGRCHLSTKGCCMRAEGASELKSTALPPSFSQRATLASSEFRAERLAGKTQSARAAPSARAERAARRQAVSLSVLWDHGWVGAKTLSHICLCCVSHTGGAIPRRTQSSNRASEVAGRGARYGLR